MKIQLMQIRRTFILMLGLVTAMVTMSVNAHENNTSLTSKDTNVHVRTPVTHGFWFPKLVTLGEEWYRGRLLQQGAHIETGKLPDISDSDNHLGFTAINATRWLITHHWFGKDTIAEEQLYSRNPNWFFDAVNPKNSVMGVFAMFRWGLLNEMDARLTIHNMIKSYTDREYSILQDGVWLYAMADLSSTNFDVNDGTRTVPNPLGVSDKEAIRYEISVIMTHHFFGRNRNNTMNVMNRIYPRLIHILHELNDGSITDKRARSAITRIIRGA